MRTSDQHALLLSTREIALVALAFLAYYLVYFASVIFDGRLLAVGDAVNQYLPALLTSPALWSHNLYAGFPTFADPQALVFSPLRLAGGNYNAAVIVVYVAAATGAYGLGRQLTQSRGAGTLTGIIYGSGGPMIVHLGHLTIIYSAAMAPFILWAIAAVRGRSHVLAVVAGALAVALALIGGHPQIFAYTMVLAGSYALFNIVTAPTDIRRKLFLRYSVLFAAGLAVACIQFLPLLEIGAQSERTQFSFAQFTSYSLSPRKLLLLFFPLLWGGSDVPYFGEYNLAEIATFCGVATPMLALAALCARRRTIEVWFWAAVFLLALAFALGASTPVARLVFVIPGLNQFRAPGRAAFETTLALSVLAGFGYQAIIARRVDGSGMRGMWLCILSLFVIVVTALYVVYPGLAAQAHGLGIDIPAALANPVVILPLSAMVVSAAGIRFLQLRPSTASTCTLVIIVAIDLAMFGWHFEWRRGVSKSVQVLDAKWLEFSSEVRASNTRVLFINGIFTGSAPTLPNRNLLYDLPTAGVYGPLILRKYADVMDLDTLGAIRSFDHLAERRKLGGVAWIIGGSADRWPLQMGGDCTSNASGVSPTATFAVPMRATHIEIVSQMGCSTGVEQGMRVLRIGIDESSGRHSDRYLVAGIDTAEAAIDRPDVARSIRHRRPLNFVSYPAGGFDAHWFYSLTDIGDGANPIAVSKLSFDWLLPPGPAFSLRGVTLINAVTGVRRELSPRDLTLDPFAGSDEVVESRPLPGARWVRRTPGIGVGAWIVGETLPLSDEAALAAIRSGRLADGRAFDPYQTALVDATAIAARAGARPLARVESLQWHNGLLKMDVESDRDAFLVIAESFYPGWHASIDGVPAPIVRTNVAFQGVRIPGGRHAVSFSFAPRSLYYGFAAAAAGIALLCLYVLFALRQQRTLSLATQLSSTAVRG